MHSSVNFSEKLTIKSDSSLTLQCALLCQSPAHYLSVFDTDQSQASPTEDTVWRLVRSPGACIYSPLLGTLLSSY